MKRNITIAAVCMNLGFALTGVCMCADSENWLVTGAAFLWLACAAWLCRRFSHLIPDDKD
jgi:hypothetical protein